MQLATIAGMIMIGGGVGYLYAESQALARVQDLSASSQLRKQYQQLCVSIFFPLCNAMDLSTDAKLVVCAGRWRRRRPRSRSRTHQGLHADVIETRTSRVHAKSDEHLDIERICTKGAKERRREEGKEGGMPVVCTVHQSFCESRMTCLNENGWNLRPSAL
jgi:hypothetical protein